MHDLRSNRQNLINSLRQQGVWLIGYLLILSIVAWLCTEVWEREVFSFDRSLLLWIHQFANPQLDGVIRVNALKFSILENCHKPGIDLTFKKHESFVRR